VVHGLAWGPWRYFGRVRPWDGLIVIVRVPVPIVGPGFLTDRGAFVFTDYLVGGVNVGSWRLCGGDIGQARFQGPFTMSKVAE
jgi:hypothetical protein